MRRSIVHTRNLSSTEKSLRPKYDAEKHIQNAKLPTFHFQDSLPRMAIPPLSQTDKKIREAVAALEGHPKFTSEKIANFENLWDDFMASDGPKLDGMLRSDDEKNFKNSNFLNAPWTEMYLRDRRPLPMNYNPTVVLTDAGQVPPNRPHQFQRAAQIAWASAKFYLTLKDHLLEPDVFHMKGKPSPKADFLARWLPSTRVSWKSKGIENQSLKYLPYAMNMSFPIDMSQYKNIMFSTRIPEKNIDRIQRGPQETRHALALYCGRFYKVELFDSNWNIKSQEEIFADFQAIQADGDARGFNKDSICPLSSAERDFWAETREMLVKNGNKKALDDVDHSMICFTLDNYAYDDAGGCCAETYSGPAANRWHDKSIQVVMGKCALPGVNFEHAWGDGAAVLSYMNKINHYIEETLADKSCILTPNFTTDKVSTVDEIKFTLTEEIKSRIQQAEKEHDERWNRLQCCVMPLGKAPAVMNEFYYDQSAKETQDIFKHPLNRNWMLSKKLGADGFTQLGLMIAGTKFYGHPVSAYESASLSSFKHGRTECIRPCTAEGQAAARIYINEDMSQVENKKKLAAAIRAAIKRHNKQTKECLGGNGWDRHIFGLRDQAKKNDLADHEVFNSETFQGLFEFPLSTSTLNSDAVSLGAFAPVVPGGFGLGYIVYPDWLGVSISGFKDEGADVYAFRELLQKVFEDMMDAIDAE